VPRQSPSSERGLGRTKRSVSTNPAGARVSNRDVSGLDLNQHFERLVGDLLEACRQHYADRLVSVVVYGSVGRGVPGPESDLDVLIVADGLPRGRIGRVTEFLRVESQLASRLAEMRAAGLAPEVSPVFKTPEEARSGSPLFLDMVEDGRILFDRERFMQDALNRLRSRLEALGARRIWRGNAWFWDLKPDYKPGEVFEL